jgi:hypothetical protein
MCLNETYRNVLIDKQLSESFPIQSGLKQGDASLPLLFNLALEYAINKVQEIQVRVELNGIYQLLAYVDVNQLGDNIATVKRKTETLTFVCFSE